MSRSQSKERKGRKYAPMTSFMSKKTSGFKASYLKLPKGASLYEVKAGKALIDIIPYEVKKGRNEKGGNPDADQGFLYWQRTFFIHRNVGPNSEAVICPARNFKERCPICEERARILKSDPDEDEEKMAKELVPKERQVFNIIDRNAKEKGVQILEMSSYTFGDTIREELEAADEGDDWDKFYTPDEGKMLSVNFTEDRMGTTKFLRAGTIHFKDRKQQYDEDEIVDKAHDLDDLLIKMNYEELAALFLQASGGAAKKGKAKEEDEDEDSDEESEDEDDEEEEDAPKKGKSSSSGKKGSSKSDSDDDEDEEEESDDSEDEEESDDDEDEEDEPKKKKGKPAAKEEDEDEDSDEEEESDDEEESEDEDDEEDEAPKKGAKKSSKKDADEEDEDDSDEDEEDSDEEEESDDDEDEEEDKPAPKKVAKKVAKDEADDFGDFDEDEDEAGDEDEEEDEDDEPKKKKGKK